MTTKTDEQELALFIANQERMGGSTQMVGDKFREKAVQAAWIGWKHRAALQSQPMPPEISRDLLGGIVDQVFGGAIEDATVIEDIYRVIACEFALQSLDREDAQEWLKQHETLMHRVSKAAIAVGYSNKGEAKLMQAEKTLIDHARRIEGES